MLHYMILDIGAQINLSNICIKTSRIGMQREIKLEKVFAKKRTNAWPLLFNDQNAWDNVLASCLEISEDTKANASKISLIQLILQQLLSANNKLTTIKSRKESSLRNNNKSKCQSEQKCVQAFYPF